MTDDDQTQQPTGPVIVPNHVEVHRWSLRDLLRDFDEMFYAYGIDPATHEPRPVTVHLRPNHFALAMQPIETHAVNFPPLSPELTAWLADMSTLGYRGRAGKYGVDTDRISRRYIELTSPHRPALPGDDTTYRMFKPHWEDDPEPHVQPMPAYWLGEAAVQALNPETLKRIDESARRLRNTMGDNENVWADDYPWFRMWSVTDKDAGQ